MAYQLFDRVERGLYAAAALSLLLIVAVMILRVLSRNFNLGFAGLQEIAQLLAVWLTFLVVGNLARDRDHIEIDYLTQRFPDRAQRIHGVLITLLNLWVAGVLLLGSVNALREFADSDSPSLGLPIPLYYAAPLVGVCFLVAVWTHRLYTDARPLVVGGYRTVRQRFGNGGDTNGE
jgi:TRAP-type C4-dicarboxylate transport system permease small subunit